MSRLERFRISARVLAVCLVGFVAVLGAMGLVAFVISDASGS